MDFVYKNPDGTFSTGLSGIGTTDYEYKPNKVILKQGLNKNKIFWGRVEKLLPTRGCNKLAGHWSNRLQVAISRGHAGRTALGFGK